MCKRLLRAKTGVFAVAFRLCPAMATGFSRSFSHPVQRLIRDSAILKKI